MEKGWGDQETQGGATAVIWAGGWDAGSGCDGNGGERLDLRATWM